MIVVSYCRVFTLFRFLLKGIVSIDVRKTAV